MNKYLYDAVTNAFYPYSLENEYKNAGTWPEKGVDVNEDEFIKFTLNIPAGKCRKADKKGHPTWVDISPPSAGELVAVANMQKSQLIADANAIINSNNWPSKLALGRLSTADKKSFNIWLDYIDAIDAIDTSTAPNIEWPQIPA